jgi:hypothetical protein
MGGRDSDPDACETARADPDENLLGTSAIEELIEHRDQPLGMAPVDTFVTARDSFSRPV